MLNPSLQVLSIDTIIRFLSAVDRGQSTVVNTPKYVFFKFHKHKVLRVQSFIGDDPKPSWEVDVKVVDILKINVALLCKIFAYWFLAGCWF